MTVREIKQQGEVRRSRRIESELNDKWAGINVYITNILPEISDALKIHELYSLRWQVEIMFKIWKSLFKIHMVKKTKIERFECFLYGDLYPYYFHPALYLPFAKMST